MIPTSLSIKDFFYDLPNHRIAQYPLQNRDDSKLLVYEKGHIKEASFKNLAHFLPEEAILVFNNTKVIQARLSFKTSDGKPIEIFCLEPSFNQEITISMTSKEFVTWDCLVGGAAKWKEEYVYFRHNDISVKAKKIKKNLDIFTVELSWEPKTLTFSEVLNHIGAMPIPPYLKRETESLDMNRYQTIYSKREGSVAAPTAGLHFTESVLESLRLKNITSAYITLHVGAGTFKPIKTNQVQEHVMHAEYIDVDLEFIKHLCQSIGSCIIAVGTTSLRTLESLYWLGVKIINDPTINFFDLALQQWEAYEMNNENISPEKALNALINYLVERNQTRLVAKTSILIAPGYQLKLVKALITNFHQPESTLMLLVAAIVGDDWKNIYQHALQNDYRFLSYGDSSLLFAK